MKYIVVIPARGGSKRLPHKNILPLAGKPLICHSIDYAKRELPGVPIYVSTDDAKIKDITITNNCLVLNRPPELSGDYISTAATLRHVAETLHNEGVDFDYMVILQCTNPLRPKGMLKEAIRLLETNKKESLIGVTPLIMKLGKINNGNFTPWNYKFGQRSQDMEPLYYENGLLYIVGKELILKEIMVNDDTIPYVINHPYSKIDIDTESDLELAQSIINKEYNESNY